MVALSLSSVISGSSPLTRAPGLDVHLDDRDVLEVADVGDLDLDRHVSGPPQSTSRRTSSRTWHRWRVKRAASAPSITRWS